MICSWSLQLLVVTSGALIIATSTNADTQQYNGPIIYPQKSEVVLKEGQNFTIICRGKSPLNFSQQELPEEVPSISRSRMEVTVNKDTDYELIANFYEVDRFTVGFYACYDNTQDIEEVLPRDIIEEPQNTDHVSYIYIYVNGSALFAPFRLIVQAKSRSKFLIECKPTSPDINVTLTIQDLGTYRQYYNPKIGFVLESGVLNGSIAVFWFCHFEGHGKAVDTDVLVHQYQLIYLSKSTAQNKTPGPVKWVKYYPKIGFVLSKAPKSKHDMTCDANREENNSSLPIVYHGEPPPMPIISGGNAYFLKGETFTINCTVNITHLMTPIELKWFIPGNMSKVQNVSNAYELPNSHLYNNYTIYNAGPEDKGTYTCQSANHHGTKNTTFEKKFIEEPFINMTKSNVKPIIETSQKLSQVFVDIVGYPRPRIEALKDNKTLPKKVQIIEKESRPSYIRYTLRILDLKFNDSGNYTVIATNNISKSVNFDIRYKGPPVIDWDLDDIKKPRGFIAHVSCTVYGYPLPEVTWIYSQGENDLRVDAKNQNDFVETIYKVTSTVRILVQDSGKLTCLASNALGSNSSTRRFLVYEIIDGFGINNTNTWFSEHDNVVLTCVASIYDFVNVSWYGEDGEYLLNVEYSTNTYSYVAKLKFESISINEAGSYVCVGVSNDGFEDSQTINITVAENRPPKVDEPEDQNEEVLIYHPMNLTCTADAVPPPNITWFKDGLPLFEDDNVKIRESKYNQSYIQSTVYIERMEEEIVGKYYCKVSSNTISVEKVFNLALKEKPSYKEIYLSVIGAIFIVLILLVIYFSWKLRKEKQFRRELKAAGLLHFKKGATKSLNPDLGIDEQAELLPYDERFEFPADKLVLGKQLGAGAFGVVYKAEARGIINAEETTTVAVKMVKKTADNMYIKALASELKIMVHLGKHVNIVNLLGACTKNVAKRELIVIVEYCKYGNIHNYLQKHREVFIDQLTDNSEKSFGKINRGFSCSSGNSGTHSEYFGSNHTQDTDHTFLNTANTSRSGRKVSETGYVQPEWRSNYESDYSFDGRSPRPLCSRDLLTWAFQIARGMEYLASRKVLHGDLAARNVLLADDNVVKICDFGLARSIYKNDEYQKKENSPLPVKWLAIECMTDRIFSTQSDVWSFGIVLWELFTLAKTPYPNVSPPSLLEYLSDGHRLEKPRYADDKLYDVMKQCWEKKPNARPTFSRLQEILGSFLEESVRNHYVDLNATYIDMNVKRDGEDYLAMVHAPDYNNMVTPNLHHYVNEANQFFPKTPTLQHDDEGYLRMSPATFNARPPATKFDFDKKLSPRVPEPNSYGSELTPMLTLNNLPRSGSESDQDGSNSPYLNMCPRIDEETDEVFETKQNNLKNTQSSAVTNPTYITFTPDDEKKSQNITNNYINVPNGLVK